MIPVKELPDLNGRYVAYINHEDRAFKFADVRILQWHDGRWYYPSSDQRYRDTVYECIGPLPILPLED